MEHDSIHHPYHEALVGYLRELRVIQRLTQVEVAAKLDRPQTYISEIENRRRGLDLLQVMRFCEIYGVDIVEFVAEWARRIKSEPKSKKRSKDYFTQRQSQRPPRLPRKGRPA